MCIKYRAIYMHMYACIYSCSCLYVYIIFNMKNINILGWIFSVTLKYFYLFLYSVVIMEKKWNSMGVLCVTVHIYTSLSSWIKFTSPSKWVNDVQFLVFFHSVISFYIFKLWTEHLNKAAEWMQGLLGISSNECS